MQTDLRRWMTLCEAVPNCVGPCLYHATYRQHLSSILNRGLDPTKSSRNFDISRAGAVYLTDNPDVADAYATEAAARNGGSVDIVILLIDQRQLDLSLLHVDENDVSAEEHDDPDYEGHRSWEYRGVIPPQAISVYYG